MLGRVAWLRKLAALLAALAMVLVLLVGIIASGLFSVDAQRLLEPIDVALTRALGREVEIAGPARLTLSFQPSLIVHNVRIANPAGFAASPFGKIEELRLDTELLPLLRSQLIVHELRGRNVSVWLEREAGGRGNWIFEPEPRAASDDSQSSFTADWRRLVFEQAVVEFTQAGMPRSLQLDSVVIEGLSGRPPQLVVQGKADAQIPLKAEAGSAPLTGLGEKEPWPFTASMEAPQTRASISGTRLSTTDGPVVSLRVDVNTTDVNEIEALLGITLPMGGAAALAGELEFAPGLTVLRNLNGRFGAFAISGEVSVDSRGARPLVSGRLVVPELDIASDTTAKPENEAEPATLATLYGVFSEAELHLARLAHFDADLSLTIGNLVDSPGDVRELSARIGIAAGRLLVPFTAIIGEAAIEGSLSADASAGVPGFGLRLATHDAPFGGLALLLFDLPHVEGMVQRFDADFTASGRTLAELIRDLEGRVNIEDARLTYGNYAGGRPIGLHITAAEFTQARGQTTAVTARGSLRGKPFRGSANAGTVEQILLERQTPFDFTGSSAGVRMRLSGFLAEPGLDGGPDIEVELSAPQALEMAPWLGFSSQSTAPVALSGRVQVREDGVKLGEGSLVFGRSSIKGELEWQRVDGKTRVEANLAAELLAPAELSGLRDKPVSDVQRTLIDLPILPETLDFGDADLELTVQGVHGLALDIADLTFSGRMRGGAIEPSPFALQLQGNELAGTLALDTRGALTTASLSLAGDSFDAGAVLRRLGLAQDIDAHFGQLHLQVAARGSRLGEVFVKSSFQASFEAGTLSYRDAGTQSSLNLALDSGELRVEPEEPVTGLITGNAGTLPVRIELEAGPLRDLLAPNARWPFAISATLAEALWEISGTTEPGPTPATEVALSLSGSRLSDLDALLATSLPPWGPYALAGQLRFSGNAYRVENVRAAIGSSVLLGSGSLDTGASPVRMEVALLAPMVQLDDFPLGDWSPIPVTESAGRMTASSARRAFTTGVDSVHPLFSRERLALGNVQVEIGVEKMLAGQDDLGSTRIAASVIDGAATFGPIEIDGRSGRAKIVIAYEPREQDAVFSARAVVDRLDYGLIATRFDPASEINGVFSLDLLVDSITPEFGKLMHTASGHIDLAVWPDRLRWSGFDLWAANLMRSLLPFFSPATSHLNCVIGYFDLDEGLLASRTLVVDTTNTRALGWVQANFTTERLRMRFVPRHKQPKLVSLAIPVEVRGTFSDYRISLRPLDALGRVAQWFKTLVMVPLHWLGVGRIPEDGHDVCTEPARRQLSKNIPELNY